MLCFLVKSMFIFSHGKVCYKISKRLHREPSYRQEGNIKLDLRQIGCEGVSLIKLDKDNECWALTKHNEYIGFKVLSAVTISSIVFWVVSP